MSRSLARRLTLVAAAGSCLAAAALPAVAEPSIVNSPDSSTVSLQAAGVGTRQLDLLDLSGQDLVDLPLRPGVASPFRVRVTDTGVSQLDGLKSEFHVEAVLNNLYEAGVSPATAAFIPSGDVELSFAASGATDAVGSVTALPKATLSGTFDSCASLLALPQLVGLSALSQTALCTALAGVTTPVADLDVVTSTPKTLTDLTELPFTLAGGLPAKTFDIADYAFGIGAADTRAPGAAATALSVLVGKPALGTDLLGELAALETTLEAQPVVSATGVGALTSTSDVIGALLTSGNAGLEQMGSVLGTKLTPAQASLVLDSLVGEVDDFGLGDILGVTGSYNTLPVLTARPTAVPAQGGTFRGTMTVTLVQK